MKVSADFTTIPDAYAKHAPEGNLTGGVPVVSFPFYISDIAPQARYVHWEFVDDDAIPVSGFQWIHWSVANLPLDALMYDFNDSHALQIPEDFSRQLPALIPEAVQGRNSAASPMVGVKDPAVSQRYNGPQPPDKQHDYMLAVYATSRPLQGLCEGFWLNELRNGLRKSSDVVDSAPPRGGGGKFLCILTLVRPPHPLCYPCVRTVDAARRSPYVIGGLCGIVRKRTCGSSIKVPPAGEPAACIYNTHP